MKGVVRKLYLSNCDNHLMKDTKHIEMNQYDLGNPAASKRDP